MADSRRTRSSYTCYYYYSCVVIGFLLVRGCNGFGTFGFDIHHRFSDSVKGMLDIDQLPRKDSVHYYAIMAHRDRVIHGRKLATTNGGSADTTPLAFFNGNDTYQITSLGFLYYANVSVGTPSLSFLVALDSGSNLFWLPCDCMSCVRSLRSPTGTLELNIYSPNTSSTSGRVTCNSSLCRPRERAQCFSAQSNCPYRVDYLTNGTSTSGFYVEDELHLISDDSQQKAVDARITFGCGQNQEGSFLDGAAPNGLLGLGMDNVSVPSTLARGGYIYNSFSMCFGDDGFGRLSFGDKGSSDQGETPINMDAKQSRSLYNISITQLSVGGNGTDDEFTAIFDSGTSFTYLNDPPYSFISENFNGMVNEKRHTSSSGLPFEYCYDISPNQQNLVIPTLNLLMKGGNYFNVTKPIEIIQIQNDAYVYCLGLVKSGDVNIIGQNFMTGYRVLFDLERKVLNWKPSNCYDRVNANTTPISPTNSSVPPATAVNPEASSGSGNGPSTSGPGAAPSSGGHSSQLNPFTSAITIVLLSFFAIV